MLSIGKLGAGQERYYLEQAGDRVDVARSIGDGIEDYYASPQEARGTWLGADARELGLSGDVSGDALRVVLAGVSPRTGVPLRVAPVRVAGFDLTFSAPKSVSVLFGVGDPLVVAAVRDGHDQAAAEAFGYLERAAAMVRRGAGGAVVEPAHGLVAATFRHRSSRMGDPQLHTHVLVANLARGPDGRWSALDGRAIYAHARAASFIYQAVLRGELSRTLGVQWTPVKDGIAEIDGVPDRVLRAFSQRRVQIERSLADRGLTGPRAAEAAALATRTAKADIAPERLVEGWRPRAEELGFGPSRVVRLLGRSRERALDADRLREVVLELTGPGGLTKERSTFMRRDVIAALCDRLPAGTTVDARLIERLTDGLLRSDLVVPLVGDRDRDDAGTVFVRRDGRALPVAQGEPRYSTPELLAIEQDLIERATTVHTNRGIASPEAVDRAMQARPSLTCEQRAMIDALATGDRRVAVVVGRAGTGKTFALSACNDAWRDTGIPVLGAAVAHRAATELETRAGIASTSVAALLAGLQRGEVLPAGAVLVVDEAGMIGTRQLATILDHVERADGKLILVGDPRQLPSIEAGGALAALARRGTAIELTDNRRQIHAWERTAVEHLREGRGHEAIQLYREHDRLHVTDTAAAARERLVADWWAARDPDQSVMIALRRNDVADLNGAARELMRAAGSLGNVELELPAGRFAAGDRVLIKRNHIRLGIANGQRGVVTDVDTRARTLAVDLGGRRVVLDHGFLDARTERGDPTLTHGYAITGHAAQGLTVDRAYVIADAGLTQEWGYTALTRGRESNHLYLAAERERARHEYAPGDPDPPDPIDRLARALSTSAAEPLAIERVGDASDVSAARRHERTADERLADAETERDRARAEREQARHTLDARRRASAAVRLLQRRAHERAMGDLLRSERDLADAEQKVAIAKRELSATRVVRREAEHRAAPVDPATRLLTRSLDRPHERHSGRDLDIGLGR